MPRNPIPGQAKPVAVPAEATAASKKVTRPAKADEAPVVAPATEVADTPAEDAPAS